MCEVRVIKYIVVGGNKDTMSNDISNNERLILLTLFCTLVLIYFWSGIFQSDINPIIKLLPFLSISLYIFIKPTFKKRNKNKGKK